MGDYSAIFQVTMAVFAVGSALYGWLFQSGSNSLGPRLRDKDLQVSTYGIPIPMIYGAVRTAGNVIWAGPWIEVAITVGKGGGGSSSTRYEYKRSFAVAFCNCEVDQLLKLWFDTKLVFNITGDGEKLAAGTGIISKDRTKLGPSGKLIFYNGTESQLPDPHIENYEGSGNVPAYRGISYLVVKNLNLSKYGNRIPNVRAMLGRATATTTNLYPVTNATMPNSLLSEEDEEAVAVLSSDEMFLYWGHMWWDTELDEAAFTWRKINTYSRTVIAEKRYYEGDLPFYYPDYFWYMSGDFAVDELNRIYAGYYYYMTRINGETFEVEQWTPPSPPYSPWLYMYFANEQTRVSTNPNYPYLWEWGYDPVDKEVYGDGLSQYIRLLNRETMSSPFDINEPAYFIGKPDGAVDGGLSAGAIDPTDASLWVLWQLRHETPIFISHIYPDGTRYDFDMSGVLADLYEFACWDQMTYDPDTARLIIGGYYWVAPGDWIICFVDTWTMTLVGQITTTGPDSYYPSATGFKRGVVDGKLVFLRLDGKIVEVDVVSMIAQEVDDISEFAGDRKFFSGVYIDYKSSMYVGLATDGINEHEVFLERFVSDTVLLSDVVEDICVRCSIATENINAVSLTQSVYGYLVADQITGTEAIRPLSGAYMFDGVESDGVINFVRRGGPSIVTVPENDLSSHLDGEERPSPLKQVIKQETDLPVEVVVQYFDKDNNQDVNVQQAKRIITNTINKQNIQLPVVMEKDRAKQLAEIMLSWAWTGRTSFEFSLGPKYLHLVPTDVITIEKAEAVYKMMITGISVEGSVLKLQALQDYESLYVSTASGIAGLLPDENIDFAGPAVWYLMDLPPLQDSQGNEGGFYIAANGYTDYFTGADVYMYNDYTGNWSLFYSVTNRAITGVAITILPCFDYNIFDESNTVTIRLDYEDHSLESITEAEIMQGQNYALLGEEIIQFQTVTDNGSGVYTLSKLLRGRKGTEWATKNHLSGERFILLTTTSIFWSSLDDIYLEVETQFRGVSHGNSFADGTNKLYTPYFRTLKPWSPVHISCTTTNTGAVISWIRRNRIQNEWLNYQDVPMSETTESYSVDFYTGATVSFTKNVSTTSCTASAASFSNIDSLLIYQMSSAVGRGFASTTVSV